jgi:hypothetical protein
MPDMGYRLITGALRALIMSAITLLAGATLVCAHAGILRLCMGTITPGITFLGVAAGLAIGAAVLIRYRNDLVDC